MQTSSLQLEPAPPSLSSALELNKTLKKHVSYKTGMIVCSSNLRYPEPPFKGKNWIAEQQESGRDSMPGDEIIILAKNREVAQKAVNLIIGCLNLFNGETMVSPGEFTFLAHHESDIQDLPMHEKAQFSRCFGTPDIPIACKIAARASYRLKYIYGLSKYNFSVSNCSLFRVDLEPHISEHISPSPFPDDHVRYCHAIISAYSVLEDLGLEIRASQKKPSIIDGAWNPIVKRDLEERLVKAKININETLLCTIRGPKRKIELKRSPRIKHKEEWLKGIVRDSSIELVDAIAYSSWLRSYIASHKTKEITKVVSVYDVINVQHLARRLLLETLGYWRYYENNLLTEF